ncbi:MAG TPA: hypothetical protein VGF23_00510 [Gaiellaceae bacterium]
MWAGLAAYPLTRDPGEPALLAALGVLAGGMLGVVLLRGWDELLPWVLLLLGVEYAAPLVVRGGPVDGAAALVGAGLLLLGELASWSLDLRTRVREERAPLRLRGLTVAAVTVAGLAAGALALAATGIGTGSGLGWAAVGAVSAVAVVAMIARLTRRALASS